MLLLNSHGLLRVRLALLDFFNFLKSTKATPTAELEKKKKKKVTQIKILAFKCPQPNAFPQGDSPWGPRERHTDWKRGERQILREGENIVIRPV